MKLSNSTRKQSGFTMVEIVIGVAILAIVLKFLSNIAVSYVHNINIEKSANEFTDVPVAVQKRLAHDSFAFSLWDENGGRAPTGNTIVWDEDSFDELLGEYLVGRKHPGCGNLATGWNPLNTAGGPDTGVETEMERTALIGCNQLRGQLPYRISLSAIMVPDATSYASKFVMYMDMDNVNFGNLNSEDNNILNYSQLAIALTRMLKEDQNGIPDVQFGMANVLDDPNDDTVYTTQECSDQLANGNKCDIIISVNFSGSTNGIEKRTDNLNSFIDDVTFKQSTASATKQRCYFWDRDAAGNWIAEQEVDCAIKAGAGDDDVVLVFDSSQSHEFIITNDNANVNAMCNVYTKDGNDKLVETANASPCGILPDGGVIQLITTNVQAEQIFSEELVSDRLYSGQVSLFNSANGAIVLDIYDSNHVNTVFQIDNIGNVIVMGTMDVDGDATFNSNASVEGSFVANEDVNLNMNNGGEVKIGNPDGNNGLVMTRNGSTDFTITNRGTNFGILASNGDEGIKYNYDGTELEVKVNAQRGVIAENGTSFHGSKSSLTGQNFSVTGVSTDEEKKLSEFVTADMARYLHDKMSDIQIVGMDRIEGEYTTLNKPNCLAFMEDSNFSSPAANPYRELIDGGLDPSTGTSYARLMLNSVYFKTYNSAFGDNQIFAQHATHSTPTTWDIYLYLSGEGAFGTGAREDGAGGSLAVTFCDYSSIRFTSILD